MRELLSHIEMSEYGTDTFPRKENVEAICFRTITLLQLRSLEDNFPSELVLSECDQTKRKIKEKQKSIFVINIFQYFEQ